MAEAKTLESDQAKPKVTFWDRDDVRGARNLLDIWASCKYSTWSGNHGSPTLEAIFEHPVAEIDAGIDEHSGLRIITEILSKHQSRGALARSRIYELVVDAVVVAVGGQRLTVPMLLALYPRVGPWQRPEYVGDGQPEESILRRFRPTELFPSYVSWPTNRALDAALEQIHRETVRAVAESHKMPAEVFAAHITAITAPDPATLRKETTANRKIQKKLLSENCDGGRKPEISCDRQRN